ncbi:hypothetical protein, conserved [Eimeria necatrix]|uniref:Uncharacterized protein n=1 Tax=Eimeria necatrix TaxID=51315 RepID=U6MMT2_9EIME|nr:hypothetical protein, conserved [Eimeria necatrix]CDJ64388.1 hypothetical protein, conserved [Eimeria necatrix]
MYHSAFVRIAAEMNAIEHINNLQGLLSSEEMEYSVPLELFAGGPTNYRRLCVSFRTRKDVESLLDTPCSFDDTVLSSLEARSEGVTPQTAAATFLESTSASHDSLLEPTTAQQEPAQEESQIASQNAELAFLLLSLRGGNYEAGARLLAADSGPCKDFGGYQRVVIT